MKGEKSIRKATDSSINFYSNTNFKNMKNFIVICFAALLSQAAFAQQTTTTPAPAAEKKSCCAPGQAKTGASCSAVGMAEATTTNAQTTGMVKKVAVTTALQTARFQVWGNCGMCKTTIEKAAKSVTGVEGAAWNLDTDQFTVVFNPAKTAVAKVHQAIAAAGYDTEAVRSDDTAYNNLHGCCQYERK